MNYAIETLMDKIRIVKLLSRGKDRDKYVGVIKGLSQAIADLEEKEMQRAMRRESNNGA